MIYDRFVGVKLIPLALVFASCGGRLGGESEDASAFVGTWLCGSIGATPGPLTITATGDELTVTESDTGPSPDIFVDASVTITCTSVYTAAGTTATLNPGSTVCTGAANIQVVQPSSDTVTVNGTTMTFVVSDPGSGPATSICTKQ
jgi:hypothetical protein